MTFRMLEFARWQETVTVGFRMAGGGDCGLQDGRRCTPLESPVSVSHAAVTYCSGVVDQRIGYAIRDAQCLLGP